MFLDQGCEIFLVIDRDSFRIETAGKLCRIFSARDVLDLRSREGDYPVVPVFPEICVEVVEVAPCRAHDDDFFPVHSNHFVIIVPAFPDKAFCRLCGFVIMAVPLFLANHRPALTFGSMPPALKNSLLMRPSSFPA